MTHSIDRLIDAVRRSILKTMVDEYILPAVVAKGANITNAALADIMGIPCDVLASDEDLFRVLTYLDLQVGVTPIGPPKDGKEE